MSFGQDVLSTSSLNTLIEETAAAATLDPSEICLNAVGIIVGLCMFLVAQLIIVFAVAHIWQKKRRNQKEAMLGLGSVTSSGGSSSSSSSGSSFRSSGSSRQDSDKKMFNPYSQRR